MRKNTKVEIKKKPLTKAQLQKWFLITSKYLASFEFVDDQVILNTSSIKEQIKHVIREALK